MRVPHTVRAPAKPYCTARFGRLVAPNIVSRSSYGCHHPIITFVHSPPVRDSPEFLCGVLRVWLSVADGKLIRWPRNQHTLCDSYCLYSARCAPCSRCVVAALHDTVQCCVVCRVHAAVQWTCNRTPLHRPCLCPSHAMMTARHMATTQRSTRAAPCYSRSYLAAMLLSLCWQTTVLPQVQRPQQPSKPRPSQKRCSC